MPDEDPEEWNRVRETIIGTSEIFDGIQLAVVEQLALNHWRSMRLRRHEIRLLNLQAGAQMEIAKRYPNGEVVEEDYEGGVAVALINSHEKQWSKFFRYDAATSRDFNRSVQQYVSLRKLPQPELQPAEIETTPAEPLVAAAASQQPQVSENGILAVPHPVGPFRPAKIQYYIRWNLRRPRRFLWMYMDVGQALPPAGGALSPAFFSLQVPRPSLS